MPRYTYRLIYDETTTGPFGPEYATREEAEAALARYLTDHPEERHAGIGVTWIGPGVAPQDEARIDALVQQRDTALGRWLDRTGRNDFFAVAECDDPEYLRLQAEIERLMGYEN